MSQKQFLGARIKGIRKKVRPRLSQEALAERVGISTQYLSNIERGRENPTLDVLIGLAKELKVSLGELFDFGDKVSLKELLKRVKPQEAELAKRIIKLILQS